MTLKEAIIKIIEQELLYTCVNGLRINPEYDLDWELKNGDYIQLDSNIEWWFKIIDGKIEPKTPGEALMEMESEEKLANINATKRNNADL